MGLNEAIAESRRMGISYGKYMVMYGRQPDAKKVIPVQIAELEMVKCEYCGRLFEKNRNKKYCCFGCTEEAKRKRDRERWKRRKSRAKE